MAALSIIKNKTNIEMPISVLQPSFFQKPEHFQYWQTEVMILPPAGENQYTLAPLRQTNYRNHSSTVLHNLMTNAIRLLTVPEDLSDQGPTGQAQSWLRLSWFFRFARMTCLHVCLLRTRSSPGLVDSQPVRSSQSPWS